MQLARKLSDKGFSGLEFVGGIPASIGGAIKMNAGAQAGEMSSIVQSVDFVSSDGDTFTLEAKEL